MKNTKKIAYCLFTALTVLAGVRRAAGQGTAFTYQGRLQDGTNAANGNYDLTFALFNAVSGGSQIGSTLTNLNVGVTNGMFTVTADFGAVYNGADYWLQLGVRTNGGGAFTPLSPRQELTPVPYSITAQNVTGAVTLAQLPGGVVTNNESGVTLDNITVGGNLSLPLPTTIFAGSGTLLVAPKNDNFYAGPGAGISNGVGLANTGVGGGSLQNNTNGGDNTAFGFQTLFNNTNGSYNTASGDRALANNTSGNDNTADGRHAMENNLVGNDNTAVGYQSLVNDTNGSFNTASGSGALNGLTSGSYNIALGYQAGANYGEGETSNILIGSTGIGGDNNTIRIGSGQTSTFIAGTINGNGGGLTNLNAAQLSGAIPLAQLPSAVVTNNESGVTLDNITLGGNLILPLPATVFAGGNTILVAPQNNNFYAGPSAGVSNGLGGANTGVGGGSLQNNTNGTNNTGFGYATLGNNSNGSYNVAIGERALADNTSGNDNTAEGRHAMVNNLVGNDNTAVGYQSLVNDTNGSFNTASGSGALNGLTSGSDNIALGYLAGNNYGEGESSNILIGSLGVGGDNNIIRIGSGQTSTFIAGAINGNGGGLTNLNATQLSGSISLARLPGAVLTNNEGQVSLGNVTLGGTLSLPTPAALSMSGSSLLYADGNNNFFAGLSAGNPGLTGGSDTAEGDGALSSLTSGAFNTADGTRALAGNSVGDANTATGYLALWKNTSGGNNTANGANALAFNVKGAYNVAMGTSALENCTGDSNEVAIGFGALENDNAGNPFTDSETGENTAVGFEALQANTGGFGNTAVGFSALTAAAEGFDNTAIGDNALVVDSSGYQNTAVGNDALGANTGGYQNVAIGAVALNGIQSGNNNIAIGFYAGEYLNSGNNNIYIGNPGVNESGVIRIGENQTATYLTGNVNCGPLTCCSITIAGGCDLAEPFPVSPAEEQIAEGSVMVIDPKNPGQLKLADRPYDTRVAGVISGANGINPGIQMQQTGLLEGGRNVALTGRVYVQADASNGAIEPGDLLTTSSEPGRAMKVTDHLRAQGAILGKAMTGLSEGKGMVLVLVSLQ